MFKNDLILANSNMTLSLFDIEKGVIEAFPQSKLDHKNKIEAMVYGQLVNKDTGASLMHSSILTASEDKVIKVWDKSTGSVAL